MAAGAAAVRYARGLHRRTVLVQAAADLLLERGLTGLSHRAVAARAGLPLASTTYYFASVDELRDEALQHVADIEETRATAVVAALPAQVDLDGAVSAVVGVLGLDAPGGQLLLLYERYLEAGRHEGLRPLVVAWNARTADRLREVLLRAALPPAEAELVLAVADGAAVTALAEGAAPAEAVRSAVGRLLDLLQPQQAEPARARRS